MQTRDKGDIQRIRGLRVGCFGPREVRRSPEGEGGHQNTKPGDLAAIGFRVKVPRDRIELPTRGFSEVYQRLLAPPRT